MKYVEEVLESKVTVQLFGSCFLTYAEEWYYMGVVYQAAMQNCE